MADKSERETVYAVPEFWVLVYKGTTELFDWRKRYTPEQATAQIIHPDPFLAERLSYIEMARATWQMRDQIDIYAGNQSSGPVWQHQEWWTDRRAIWEAHGVRPSVKQPGLLAYYQSADKACLGILTPIRAGRYLGKFFSDCLSEKERARLAQWQETGAYPSDYANEAKFPLAFADTEAAIVDVYLEGPHSCMSNEVCDYETDGTHPVSVYAAGDVAVAYLKDSETGKVRARALTWPARKVFGRVYPTEQNYDRDGFADSDDAQNMQNALRNRLLGMDYSAGSFNGAKLQKIKIDCGKYVMPYLDGDYSVNDRCDVFLMEDGGEYRANNTDGTITIDEEEEDDRPICNRCEDRMDDYEERTVYMRANSNGGTRPENWCEHCTDNYAFRCEGFDEYFSDNHVSSVEVDGTTYSDTYASDNFTMSDFSNEYFDGESVDMADGETWSQDEFDAHGFTCAIDGKNYPVSERHADHPEIHCDTDDEAIAAWLDRPIDDDRQTTIAERLAA